MGTHLLAKGSRSVTCLLGSSHIDSSNIGDDKWGSMRDFHGCLRSFSLASCYPSKFFFKTSASLSFFAPS